MPEYLDVLDENGNLTGQRKLRADIHKSGDLHREVFVFTINNQNQVLMQLRSPMKSTHPNQWDLSVAGHVVSGDDSLATVTKEFYEELGIKINKEEPEFLFGLKKKSVHGQKINFVIRDIFLLQKNIDLGQIVLQKEEVSAVKYISLDDLKLALRNNDPSFINRDFYPRVFEILEERAKDG